MPLATLPPRVETENSSNRRPNNEPADECSSGSAGPFPFASIKVLHIHRTIGLQHLTWSHLDPKAVQIIKGNVPIGIVAIGKFAKMLNFPLKKKHFMFPYFLRQVFVNFTR